MLYPCSNKKLFSDRRQRAHNEPQESVKSVEIFLKLDGIYGGTRNFTHKGWSDVTFWSWEMQSNRSSTQKSEGDKTGFRQMTIVKRIGMESAHIMSLFAKGRTIASADLVIVPVVTKREAKQKYLSIHMEDVRVKSIVTGGNAAEEFFMRPWSCCLPGSGMISV